MSVQFKIINRNCNDPRIMRDLNESYQRMMGVPYTDDVIIYFQNLFSSLQGTGPNFCRMLSVYRHIDF